MSGFIAAIFYLLGGLLFVRWALKKLRHDCYKFPSPALKWIYCTFMVAFWLPFSVVALAHRAMGR